MSTKSLDNMVSNITKNKVAWTDLQKKYPNRWVLFNEMEYVDDERVFLCNFLEDCDDDSRDTRKLYYIHNNVEVIAVRTTPILE